MKKYFLILGLIMATALGSSTLRAQTDTNAMATNAVAMGTNAVAAATTNAPATPPPLPTGTLDQRVGALEAYIANTDPTAGLKDTNGTQIATTVILGN